MLHTKYTRIRQICTMLEMVAFTAVSVITLMLSMVALA